MRRTSLSVVPALGVQSQQAQRVAGMRGQLMQERQVHRRLRRLVRESGRSPDRHCAAVRSENQRFRQALCVNVLEQSVQAIDDQVNRQAAAVGQRGGGIVVEQIGKGPLLFRAVTL